LSTAPAASATTAGVEPGASVRTAEAAAPADAAVAELAATAAAGALSATAWLAVVERAIAALPEPRYLLLAGSPVAIAPELLKACAATAAKTIAVDAGAKLAQTAGLQVDELVGDMDSVSPALRTALAAGGVEVFAVSAHKDQTDLELAFARVVDKGAASVLLLGALGGRLDHELAALGACAAVCDKTKLLLVADEALVWLQGAGSSVEVGRYLQNGQLFSTIALSDDAVVSEEGSEWELDGVPLRTLDPCGVSNTVQSAGARVSVISGVVAVIAPRGM
jgi:thiamine pyrophosphokinase